MINMKKITIKNLMSVGNSPIIIELDAYKKTLITGKNGTGKSTILIEALTYALFGKPYRNINMPLLVNTTNKKGMEVKLEFEVDGAEYEVRRGIGPKVFEIRKDSVIIEEDASTGDYQTYLEDKILQMTLKAFKQIVVLGTAGYVPFMQLTTPKRREVIEDLLDIQLLSIMAAKNKERVSIVQSDIVQAEHNLQLMTQKQSMLQKQQADDKVKVDELIQAEKTKLVGLEHKLEVALTDVLTSTMVLAKLGPMLSDGSYQEALPGLYAERGTLQAKIADHKKMLHFLTTNDNCPVCTQKIDTTFKEKKVFELDMTIDEIGLRLDEKVAGINVKEVDRVRDQKIKTKIQEVQSQKAVDESSVRHIESAIQSCMDYIKTLEAKEFKDMSQQLVKLEQMINKVSEHRLELMNDKYCYAAINAILKDSGVKSVIIGQYIPVMNKLINDYLTKMGAMYTFELDSEFNETVKTRGMENFVYNSFSEGQKYRIDISILFAWRDLVRLISGSRVNVLVLDEVMDGSSDTDGIDALVEILDHIDDSIYVISHSEKIEAMEFDRTIDVQMNGKFSEIKISV
ncbi:hypothetical protein D3C76_77720 [compost metagenome]